ncbi:hypothetical protein ABW286_12640 [Erwinia papayae]|uniref:Uncharacterized protein n=1 Tax=Erwinia papayae TaxID=206499 RepID=A0ABV3N2I7_9GAMM
MSSYNKQQHSALLAPVNAEKKALEAFVSAELKMHSVNAEAHLHGLKASLKTGKKHSSATLLRRKLKGHLVRELHEI